MYNVDIKQNAYILIHFFKDFIYLFIHERHTHTEAETQLEGEVGSMQEPDAGLDPGTPGSPPEPKADAQPLSHPGATYFLFFSLFLIFLKRFYLLIHERHRETEREAETQAEGEAGSMQGA